MVDKVDTVEEVEKVDEDEKVGKTYTRTITFHLQTNDHTIAGLFILFVN